MKLKQKVTVTKNGPYVVSGNIPLSKTISIVGSEGVPEKWQQGKKYPEHEKYALCSCGKSQNKPYCDGTHIKTGFNAAEKAGKKQYKDQARVIYGPQLDLTDAKKFCSNARFCQLSGDTWHNVERSDGSKFYCLDQLITYLYPDIISINFSTSTGSN